MSKHSGPPLRKVTLNLYDRDCDEMQRLHGYGWSEQVRDLVHAHIARLHASPLTVADLTEDPTDG